MKVLLEHFQIQDWGGIVNYSEFLARGLKSQGHEVESVMLKNKGKTGIPKVKDRSGTQGWEFGSGLGLWMHQKSGWEGMYNLNYVADVAEGEDWASDYDLVIYIVPVPTCSKATKGDEDWLRLFGNTSAKQLAVVHDGNMQKLYPHLLEVCDRLDGIVCVHDASFNSCDVLPIRRAFIPNPHEYDPLCDITPMSERTDGFVSMQTFKRWKRVDDLVRAIPHMDDFHEKIVCGGGIEYHYMTSVNKCKPEYMDKDGNKIWDNALEAGMDFRGYITTAERDTVLQDVKLLIDPSWSLKYSELGAHFNRVMVEAMSWGCVPVCTDLGMKNSMLFEAGVNYIEVPYNSNPVEYANYIDNALADNELLTTIQQNNLKLIEMFDKEVIAKSIIDFAFGNGDWPHGETVCGELTEKLKADAKRKMEHFEDF
jgi:glycosyltransferase involved in cell wall biosynthesis